MMPDPARTARDDHIVLDVPFTARELARIRRAAARIGLSLEDFARLAIERSLEREEE